MAVEGGERWWNGVVVVEWLQGGTSRLCHPSPREGDVREGHLRLFREALPKSSFEVLRDFNLKEAMEPNSQTSEVHRGLTLFLSA
jgi:hypothetical protein